MTVPADLPVGSHEVLVAYLLARYGEAEAGARAASVKQGDPEWTVHGPIALSAGAYRVRSDRDRRPIALTADVAGDDETDTTGILDGRAVAEHIARWDPAAVLADLDAKRRIVARHTDPRHLCPDPVDPDWLVYIAGERTTLTYPCGDLLDLARPYSDRLDYLPEWSRP